MTETIELKVEKFDQNLVDQQYYTMKSEFENDFELNHLGKALNGIKISELKNEKEYEKEMLF